MRVKEEKHVHPTHLTLGCPHSSGTFAKLRIITDFCPENVLKRNLETSDNFPQNTETSQTFKKKNLLKSL